MSILMDSSMFNANQQPKRSFSNGLMEVFQVGKQVTVRSLLTREQSEVVRRSLIEDLPKNKKRMDERVRRIRSMLSELDPASLLKFSFAHELMRNVRTGDPEIDRMMAQDFEEHPSRFTEYIQSLYVANGAVEYPSGEPIAGNDEEFQSKALAVMAEIAGFEGDIQSFLFFWTASRSDEMEDSSLVEFALEAQLLYRVRGERYQSLQGEYYERLLLGHTQEFQECFGLTSEELVDGFKKLEYALSNEMLDSIKGIATLYDSLTSDAGTFVEPTEEQSKVAQQLFKSAFSIERFSVSKVTGWPDSFIDRLSYGLDECLWPEPHGDYQYWPITYLPVMRRPFVRVGNDAYCFDYYSLVDNFYRAVYWALCGESAARRNRWQKTQQHISEHVVADLLHELLPDGKMYFNNYYRHTGSKGKGQLSENDLLVLHHDTVIVVEVKAGGFVYTPPFVDLEGHIESYKALIEKADHQCNRTAEFLIRAKASEKGNASFVDRAGKCCFSIDMKPTKNIIELSVTVDNINAFAARAERLSFLDLKSGAISLALDDLMVYRDYFTDSQSFIDYLVVRAAASHNERLALNDELDHLGMYIEYGDYPAYVDTLPNDAKLNFDGYRDDFDAFYGTRGTKRAERGELKSFTDNQRVIRYIQENGKPGRNEKCPCGSGKKNKRCHGGPGS